MLLDHIAFICSINCLGVECAGQHSTLNPFHLTIPELGTSFMKQIELIKAILMQQVSTYPPTQTYGSISQLVSRKPTRACSDPTDPFKNLRYS